MPIDGGVSLLLAGGVAFGIKQLRARRLARRSTK
ncbi:PID-CTERM protein-sorting domain-containing protein [Hymenobacter humi]|uniref:PID-CTERM protein-sorting domain-containing protein n=1 Tax=Hymenobacter humi TaxID=1411620 RepID=A0ABW2UEX1_9BACT